MGFGSFCSHQVQALQWAAAPLVHGLDDLVQLTLHPRRQDPLPRFANTKEEQSTKHNFVELGQLLAQEAEDNQEVDLVLHGYVLQALYASRELRRFASLPALRLAIHKRPHSLGQGRILRQPLNYVVDADRVLLLLVLRRQHGQGLASLRGGEAPPLLGRRLRGRRRHRGEASRGGGAVAAAPGFVHTDHSSNAQERTEQCHTPILYKSVSLQILLHISMSLPRLQCN